MTKTFKFDVKYIPDPYRHDTPTPAEYRWYYCSRCKQFHQHNPLFYNEVIDSMTQQMADRIDADILASLRDE